MLGAEAIRKWYLVHKWTSLICTIFLLLLCITGLPLIFYHEIDHLLGHEAEPAAMPGVPTANLDRIVATGLARHPGNVVQYLSFDDEAPIVYLTVGPTPRSAPELNHTLTMDSRTAEIYDVPPFDEGFMWVMFKLHTDLYAGLPGMLFLGFMGLLFAASIVSGIVVYGPFMRRLDFGTAQEKEHASQMARSAQSVRRGDFGLGVRRGFHRRDQYARHADHSALAVQRALRAHRAV